MHGPDTATDELITTTEAARILGLHYRTVHRYVTGGALVPERKIAGRTGAYLFWRADVEALAATRRGDAPLEGGAS